MRAGVDIVGVERLGRAVVRTPRLPERVFTPGERAAATRDGVAIDHPVALARLAARFAAKEATMKALGERLAWHDVEVVTDPDGAPRLLVRGEPAAASLSLSHDAGVAVAFVVATAQAVAPAQEPRFGGTDALAEPATGAPGIDDREAS